MWVKTLTLNSWFVALVAAALAIGTAQADHGGHGGHGGGGHGGHGHSGHGHGGGGGGGGHGGRSFSGGGGGGGGSSMRSFSGGRGSGHSGGASSMRSFSGGGGGRNSMRSFSGGPREWSGGGGGNNSLSRSRGPSNHAWSGGGGGSRNAAHQLRDFSGGGNLAHGNSSHSSNDVGRQYRAFHSDSHNNSYSGGGNPAGRGRGNEHLQQMFRNYHRQQAASGNANKTFDPSHGHNWSKRGNSGVDQAAFNRLPGSGGSNDNNRPGHGHWNRIDGGKNNSNFASSDAVRHWQESNRGNAARRIGESGHGNHGGQRPSLGVGGHDVGGGHGSLDGNRRGRDGNHGGQGNHFADWSKQDGGNFNPKTARWYGNSGFGDHRGRGGDNGGGHGDNKFPDGGPHDRGPWNGGKGDGNWAGGDWNHGKWHGDGKWNGNGHGHGDGKWDGNHGDGHGDGSWHGGGKWHGRDKWGDHVRDDWNNNWWNKNNHNNWGWRGGWWNYDAPFCYDWWGGRRNSAWCYWGNRVGWRNNPWYWWGNCSAPLVTNWVNFGWNYPCYWDYGPNEYITYQNNAVYVDGQRYATELEYYSQVRNLARSVPTLTQDQLAALEWLPLGVFAVTRPGAQQSNELMQIAVSKDGILSGTLLDQRTGQSRPLQGMVEQATQKAAWTFADSPTDALVIETSLYNLTEPQCSALAHLDAVSTEVWQLTRLQQPQQQVAAPAIPGAAQAPAAAAPAPQVNAPAPAPAIPPQAPAAAPAGTPVLPPQDLVK